MQDLSGDSTSKASSPKPTPSDNRPQTTRGGGRPAGDNIRIPWQVLELTTGAAAAAAAASGGGGSSTGVSVVGEVKKPEDPNRSEGSRRVVSYKRKHSDIITEHSSIHQHPRLLQPQPVSPTKSPVQQEASGHETPANGDDDAVKHSSDDVASQENEEMKPSAAVVSEKEQIGVKPFEAKEKNEENPSADADGADDEDKKDVEFSEVVEEENKGEPSVDDAVINEEEDKEMESLEAAEEKKEEDPSDDNAVTDVKNKEMESSEEAAEERKEDEPSANKGGKDKEGFETGEEKNEKESSAEKESGVETAEEKHEEEPSGTAGEKPAVTESSHAAQKRMKFLFDLNELPGDEDDDMP